MNQITVGATFDQVKLVMDFVNAQLAELCCSEQVRVHVDVAIDEIFGNIVQYAYKPEGGPVTVRVEVDDHPLYASSAGLRVFLRLMQAVNETVITNVHSELYEILDMTGFTEMTKVRKAYRVISVEGCEAIGQGANGKVYRTDLETIVKVYLNPDALSEIHCERELAFVAGVPTAIPYDVVRIEGEATVLSLSF